MEELVYQKGTAFLKSIWDAPPESICLLCPVCGGTVLFAPDWKRAREFAVHPGAYCTVDRKHFIVMFELTPEAK